MSPKAQNDQEPTLHEYRTTPDEFSLFCAELDAFTHQGHGSQWHMDTNAATESYFRTVDIRRLSRFPNTFQGGDGHLKVEASNNSTEFAHLRTTEGTSWPFNDGLQPKRGKRASPELPRCWEHGCEGRTFSCRENYLRHLRERGSKEYRCPVCNVSFSRKSNMDAHRASGRCKHLTKDGSWP